MLFLSLLYESVYFDAFEIDDEVHVDFQVSLTKCYHPYKISMIFIYFHLRLY